MSLNVGQVINRALRMHGVIADGEEPAASIGSDMLVAANAMKRAWFGTLIGPRMSPQAFAGTTGQAENGGEYSVPGGAAFSVSAPLNPKAGARFGVIDGAADFGTYNCTVSGNGRLIAPIAGAGAAGSTTVMNANGQFARWWFRGDNGTWTLEQDWPLLTSAIEFPDPIIAYMPYMLAAQIASEFGADITPEMGQGAMEGREALARSYARRGIAGLDQVIGLAGAAPAQPQGR
jgi:hypothetical protein